MTEEERRILEEEDLKEAEELFYEMQDDPEGSYFYKRRVRKGHGGAPAIDTLEQKERKMMAPQYEVRLVLPGFDDRLKTFEKIAMREASIRELILLALMSLPKAKESDND